MVVGVAGTLSSEQAVRWAGEQAAARGAELVLVHAVGAPRPGYGAVRDEAMSAGITQMLEREAERAPPAAALLAAADDARLLVVGSRALHGVARMLLGSTSHAAVLHSPCPVLVVRL